MGFGRYDGKGEVGAVREGNGDGDGLIAEVAGVINLLIRLGCLGIGYFLIPRSARLGRAEGGPC